MLNLFTRRSPQARDHVGGELLRSIHIECGTARCVAATREPLDVVHRRRRSFHTGIFAYALHCTAVTSGAERRRDAPRRAAPCQILCERTLRLAIEKKRPYYQWPAVTTSLSCTVSEILSIICQNVKKSRDHDTPLSGTVYHLRLGLAMIKPHTKLEVSMFTHYEDILK